jgi:ATP-dependent Lon protease
VLVSVVLQRRAPGGALFHFDGTIQGDAAISSAREAAFTALAFARENVRQFEARLGVLPPLHRLLPHMTIGLDTYPAQAIVEGGSLGLAVACALLSALYNRPVQRGTAFTGTVGARETDLDTFPAFTSDTL